MSVNPSLFALARMTVSSSGTGTITLNTAVSGFLTFDLAGCSTAAAGQRIVYAISDTTQSEIGTGVYNSSGTKLTRGSSTDGLKSTNSDSPINMSNAAQVFITPQVSNFAPPTMQVIASTSTTTYNAPINVRVLLVEAVGGGGGGAASGLTPGSGTAGGDTVWNSSATAGGGGGATATTGAGGGVASNGDLNINGGDGHPAAYGTNAGGIPPNYAASGNGGNSVFGGGGRGFAGNQLLSGDAGKANSGGGGGGSVTSSTDASATSGGGGGAGGYFRKLVTNPSSTYTISIGSAGNGGTVGTAGAAGGGGGKGVMIVTEFYS